MSITACFPHKQGPYKALKKAPHALADNTPVKKYSYSATTNCRTATRLFISMTVSSTVKSKKPIRNPLEEKGSKTTTIVHSSDWTCTYTSSSALTCVDFLLLMSAIIVVCHLLFKTLSSLNLTSQKNVILVSLAVRASYLITLINL